ncbi:TPA: hypothetical protein ACH3X2_008447 [Trebouxia sp. C0005]
MCFAKSPLQADSDFSGADDVLSEDNSEDNNEEKIAQLRSEFSETYRAKWLLDNCTSIADMIDRLHQEADRLAKLQSDGWKLEDEILDDYGWLLPPDLEERVASALRDRDVTAS